MARDFAVSFYHSRAWRHAQAEYMAATVPTDRGPCPPYMCERCFARGELVPAEIVHHKTWLTPDNIDDPSVSLSPDNLMRVCRDCHAQIHFGSDFEQRVCFDEDGRVVPIA